MSDSFVAGRDMTYNAKHHLLVIGFSALVVGVVALVGLFIAQYFKSAPPNFWSFALFVFPLPFLGWYAVWRTLRAAYSSLCLLVWVLWNAHDISKSRRERREAKYIHDLIARSPVPTPSPKDPAAAAQEQSIEYRQIAMRRLFAYEVAKQVLPSAAVAQDSDSEGEEWKRPQQPQAALAMADQDAESPSAEDLAKWFAMGSQSDEKTRKIK